LLSRKILRKSVCESNILDYNQADVIPEENEDPEEIKKKTEEEAKRRTKPEHFKGNLLSKAGEGKLKILILGDSSPPKTVGKFRKKPTEDSIENEGKIIGEMVVKDLDKKEDYFEYLQKAVNRKFN
jgi:hypothetical protein